MARLCVFLLGPFEATLDGEPIAAFKTDKARALLAYLALEAEHPHRRGRLAGLLWPDQPESEARHNLAQALHRLRTAIGDRTADPPFLTITRQTIGLAPAGDTWLDVAAFRDALSACRAHRHTRIETCDACAERLEAAVALYRGELLAGFTLNSALYEEWLVVEREELHRGALEALHTLARYQEVRGAYERAVAYGQRQIELEGWRESAHRQVMRGLALSGDRAGALAQYEACRRLLAEELGVEPDAETTQLYERIRDGAELRPLSALPRHNLPAQLTPLVGREDALSEIEARLEESACRLLTLVGPGGSGKTRLALEVAARQVDGYRDGVFYVPLAPLRTVDAIVPAIAQAIGLILAGGRDPRRQLLNGLRRKEMLLVLDNCEHLLGGHLHSSPSVPADPNGSVQGGEEKGGAAAVATEILQAAPDVQIVATSRVGLNMQGESLYPVSGLDVPPHPSSGGEDSREVLRWREAENLPAPDTVQGAASYSAVQLFVSNARRVRPNFELAAENVVDVVRICHLVAGMPLGILLAATWLKMLTPAEIVDQVAGHLAGDGEGGLDFLETDLRDVPARQRSMRAVFDHSWRLLSAPEQEVFARLSVFHGGFTAEAARAVSGASLRTLMGFVSQSLLQRDRAGRYDIHELLRQYAEEQLGAVPGEVERARDLHGTYYAEFLCQREPDVFKGYMQEVLSEIDNVHAGWRWNVRRGKAAEILKSLLSLWLVYNATYWSPETEVTFGEAAESMRREDTGAPGETREVALGLALATQGFCVRMLHDTERAAPLFQEGLALLSKHGVRRELALGKWFASINLPKDGPQYQQLLQESLAISQEVGFDLGTVTALRDLGRLEEALHISRQAGDLRGTALALAYLGWRAYAHQEYARARQFHEESLALFQELGMLRHAGKSLGTLGDVALALGECEVARARYWQLHDQCTRIGNDLGIVRALVGLGNVALAEGDRGTALRIYRPALELALQLQADPFATGAELCLDVVAGWAALPAGTDGERAVELAALSRHHPSSAEETREKAQRLLDRLQGELAPAAFAAAVERGRTRDLKATVKELLAEQE